MRWRNSSVSSTGETCLVLMRFRRSAAVEWARFWLGTCMDVQDGRDVGGLVV